MGSSKYPTLTKGEVIAIIESLGFVHKRTVGSHAQFERPADAVVNQRRIVTVDVGKREFSLDLTKSMIRQSGFSQFYGATKRTALRASVEYWLKADDSKAD